MKEKLIIVELDKELNQKAIEKANAANLPSTTTGLVRYLLGRYVFGNLKYCEIEKLPSWTYSDTTTSIKVEPGLFQKAKSKFLKEYGLVPNNKFIVNYLLANYFYNN